MIQKVGTMLKRSGRGGGAGGSLRELERKAWSVH